MIGFVNLGDVAKFCEDRGQLEMARLVGRVEHLVRFDGRVADAIVDGKPRFFDQCQHCDFKISAPVFGSGQLCPQCGGVARP